MIEATKNLKHRCMLSLLYSVGLRRGELLGLKVTDIDSQRMLIKIKQGKGGKDRVMLLANVYYIYKLYEIYECGYKCF